MLTTHEAYLREPLVEYLRSTNEPLLLYGTEQTPVAHLVGVRTPPASSSLM